MMNYTLLNIQAHVFITSFAIHYIFDYSYSTQYVDLAVLLLLLHTPSRLGFFFSLINVTRNQSEVWNRTGSSYF